MLADAFGIQQAGRYRRSSSEPFLTHQELLDIVLRDDFVGEEIVATGKLQLWGTEHSALIGVHHRQIALKIWLLSDCPIDVAFA